MNRIELVQTIATQHDLSKAEAARVLETITSAIVTAVKKGDTVQILGFGTFKQVARAARAAFKAAVDPKGAKRKADKAAAKTAAAPVTAKKAAPAKKAAAPAKKTKK